MSQFLRLPRAAGPSRSGRSAGRPALGRARGSGASGSRCSSASTTCSSLVPLGLYLLVRRAHGALTWSRARAVVLPVLLLAGPRRSCHAAFWSRKYVLSVVNRPYWEQPWWVWLAVAAGSRPPCSLVAHRLEPRVVRWMDAARPAAAARPDRGGSCCWRSTPTSSGRFSPPGPAATATRSPPLAHRGCPDSRSGFHRLAAHDAQSLVRLGWFVTWPVLVLAVAGCVWLLRRWESALALARCCVAGTYALFYFYKIRIYNDYYFALRRFMPVVVPVAARPGRGGARRALGARPRRAASSPAALAAAVAALFLRDTLPLAPLSRLEQLRALRGRPGAAVRPPGRGDLRAAAQRAPALAAAVGRARRQRAGAGAVQSRPRAARSTSSRPGAGGIATSTSSTPTARTSAACSSSTSRT